MPLKRTGYLILLSILFLAITIAVLFLPNALTPASMRGVEVALIRFLGLYGFLFLSITALTTPFLVEITRAFGRSFIKIHHAFAATGLLLITLHPIFNALQTLTLQVFVPIFSSWISFWTYAGRLALYLLYIGIAAALLRMKSPRYWRIFHALVYVVLFFGIVHANLLGGDFTNIGMQVIFDTLFVASIVGLVYKRYRNYAIRRKYQNLKKNQPKNET